jgi:choline dehydrogenase-like flavoprotein
MLNRPGGLEIVRDEWRRLAVYYVMIVPEGRGRVRALPGLADPLVTVSLTRRDMGLLALGLKRLAAALLAAGARRLYPTVAGLGPFASARDLDLIPPALPSAATSLMTVHLTSSCAMSGDPNFGVTDQWGAVHGAKDLYVSDAGLLPSAPGVNPQGPLLAVCRRNALHWLEQARPR